MSYLILLAFALPPQAPMPPQVPAVATCRCGTGCPLGGGCEACACAPPKVPDLPLPKPLPGLPARPEGEGWRWDARGWWWRYPTTDELRGSTMVNPPIPARFATPTTFRPHGSTMAPAVFAMPAARQTFAPARAASANC